MLPSMCCILLLSGHSSDFGGFGCTHAVVVAADVADASATVLLALPLQC